MNRLSFQCRHTYPGGFTIDAAFETETQVTALFGPSGAGKTSILYLIAGLLRPQAGQIRWGDTPWLDTAQGRCVKPQARNVGLVFQDHLLFPHLSVQSNLLYGRRRRPRRAAAIDARRVIEVLELGDLLARYPRNLSGGEKQRVALGRSLLSGPELLLLDEPLAALDQPLKDRILTYFERVLTEWRVPAIYVSHSAAEVRRMAERVIVVEGGRSVACGAPDELLLDRLAVP
ncbi:MAG: ATP-binding cassette domain-containing protein [Pirellulales bacterium]